MHIYWKINPAKFQPDSIWNDGAKAFLKMVATTITTQQQQPRKIFLLHLQLHAVSFADL